MIIKRERHSWRKETYFWNICFWRRNVSCSDSIWMQERLP